MSGGGGESQTVNNAPWIQQQAYLEHGYRQAANNLQRNQPRYFPGSTVVGPSAASQAAMRMMQGAAGRAQNTLNAAGSQLGGLMATGGIPNMNFSAFNGKLNSLYGQLGKNSEGYGLMKNVYGAAGQPLKGDKYIDATYKAAQAPLQGDQYLKDMYAQAGKPLEGDQLTRELYSQVGKPTEADAMLKNTYANAVLNPTVKAELEKTTAGDYLGGGQFMRSYGSDIINAVNNQFAASGRSGGAYQGNAMAEGLGDAAGRLYGDERNRQLSAAELLSGRELGYSQLRGDIANNLNQIGLGRQQLQGGLAQNLSQNALAQTQMRGEFANMLSNNRLNQLGLQGNLGNMLSQNRLQQLGLQGQMASNMAQDTLGRQGLQLGAAQSMASNSLQAQGLEAQMAQARASNRLQALGMAPALAEAQSIAPGMLASAGAMREQYAQRALDDRVNRWNFNQNRPNAGLSQYMQMVSGGGSPGSYQTSTGPGPNRPMAALGGAATGAALGSAVPGIGTGLGAAAGGLIGWFS